MVVLPGGLVVPQVALQQPLTQDVLTQGIDTGAQVHITFRILCAIRVPGQLFEVVTYFK